MSTHGNQNNPPSSQVENSPETDDKSNVVEPETATEHPDWSTLSRFEKWSILNHEFQRAVGGKGIQKRYRISAVLCRAIELMAEELGTDENAVVEHAVLTFFRNLLDPFRNGFGEVQNALELLLVATDELDSEISAFTDVALHVSVAEISTCSPNNE